MYRLLAAIILSCCLCACECCPETSAGWNRGGSCCGTNYGMACGALY